MYIAYDFKFDKKRMSPFRCLSHSRLNAMYVAFRLWGVASPPQASHKNIFIPAAAASAAYVGRWASGCAVRLCLRTWCNSYFDTVTSDSFSEFLLLSVLSFVHLYLAKVRAMCTYRYVMCMKCAHSTGSLSLSLSLSFSVCVCIYLRVCLSVCGRVIDRSGNPFAGRSHTAACSRSSTLFHLLISWHSWP